MKIEGTNLMLYDFSDTALEEVQAEVYLTKIDLEKFRKHLAKLETIPNSLIFYDYCQRLKQFTRSQVKLEKQIRDFRDANPEKKHIEPWSDLLNDVRQTKGLLEAKINEYLHVRNQELTEERNSARHSLKEARKQVDRELLDNIFTARKNRLSTSRIETKGRRYRKHQRRKKIRFGT